MNIDATLIVAIGAAATSALNWYSNRQDSKKTARKDELLRLYDRLDKAEAAQESQARRIEVLENQRAVLLDDLIAMKQHASVLRQRLVELGVVDIPEPPPLKSLK